VTEFGNGSPNQVVNLSGYSVPLTYDSRDYVFNPSKGIYGNLALNANTEWLGSDISFTTLALFLNHYKRIHPKGVFASRLYFYTGLGDVPFVGLKVVGGKDLRGYTRGEYRSEQVASLQAEYRHSFNKKWGAVGFGGFAYAFPYGSTDGSGLLPSIGAGARYMVIPKRRMNMGVDIAAGKGDWGIYFRVGEAF
jgi:outer membrane protein assembly factor BamA